MFFSIGIYRTELLSKINLFSEFCLQELRCVGCRHGQVHQIELRSIDRYGHQLSFNLSALWGKNILHVYLNTPKFIKRPNAFLEEIHVNTLAVRRHYFKNVFSMQIVPKTHIKLTPLVSLFFTSRGWSWEGTSYSCFLRQEVINESSGRSLSVFYSKRHIVDFQNFT